MDIDLLPPQQVKIEITERAAEVRPAQCEAYHT
jgi:hypothetical protein